MLLSVNYRERLLNKNAYFTFLIQKQNKKLTQRVNSLSHGIAVRNNRSSPEIKSGSC